MTAISLDRPAPVLGGFTLTYLRIELVRKLRNPRALFFTVAFPVLMFFIIGYQMLDEPLTQVRVADGGVSVAAYIMVSMAMYGAMMSATQTGAAVAVERAQGWTRQLRLTPWIGEDVRWMWTFVGVAVAVSSVARRPTWILVLLLSALSFVVGEWSGADTFTNVLNSAIILSISIMMLSFVQNITTLERLRAAQEQVAELAAERERSRVARDVHDILGHSLTVITVKAELAGRLMDAGSPAARDEVGQIEQLSRGALADVRATVHGYRGVSISGELAAARAALESAGVAPELPGSTDQVPSDRRELAGWVVREAVTNVVRHAEASVCRVSLDSRSVEVADDGRGPSGASSGSGLSGLRERVETAGGRMSVGRSDLGGFRVKVTW